MFSFTVKPDDGEPFDAEASMRDVLKWERGGKGRSISQLKTDPRLSDLYAIAHLACKRQQMFTGSLEQFEDSVDIDFEEEDEEEDGEPDPTRADH